MTCTKLLVIPYFFLLLLLLQIVYGLPKVKENYQCDISGKQLTSEFLTAYYLLDSSTSTNNDFLGTVRINSMELFAVLPLDYHEVSADLLLRSPLFTSSFQSCLYTCKEHPICHSLLYHRSSKECKIFKEVALENKDVQNLNFVGREDEVVFEQEDLLYAQKICLSRSDKWCENPSRISTTNEYMMFQDNSNYVTNWIDQILSKICMEQCSSNALCSLTIENKGDRCYARESRLVSYNCNTSQKTETEKNKSLFVRLDEPINFENSNNNQAPLCKRCDCISPFSPIGVRGDRLWWLGWLPSIILSILILSGAVIVIRYWYISKRGESAQITNRQEDLSNIRSINLNRSTAPLYFVSANFTIRNVLQIPSNIQTVRPNLIRNDDPPSYEVACGSDYLHNEEEPPPGYHSLDILNFNIAL